MSDDSREHALTGIAVVSAVTLVTYLSLFAGIGALLTMSVTKQQSKAATEIIQPIEPTDPVKGTSCAVVTETDMMLGHTMSKMQPYFDKGLETCLALYRPNTQDYLICFCEQRK